MNTKYLNIWYGLIIIISLFFVTVLSIPVQAQAKQIDFKDNYQDWTGTLYKYDNVNLSLHPFYTVVLNGSNYTISRMGTNVSIPIRSWISYNLYPDRIQPIVTIQNFTQINGLVTKVNSSVWFLTAPWSASQVISVSDSLIDIGVFKRSLDLMVTDANGNTSNKSNVSYSILPKVVGGDIRLYLNPQTYANFSYPLIITENTITVNNTTTSGWSSTNISLNGSRINSNYELALAYNSSIYNGLVGCWDMDATTGDKILNCNNANGTLNQTDKGTWYGNTTINSTSGIIGNAIRFDGVNDYVDAGNDASLNTSAMSISMWVNPNFKGDDGINHVFYTTGTWTNAGLILFKYTNNKLTWQVNATQGVSYNISTWNINQWYNIVATINSTINPYMELYINGLNVANGTISATTRTNMVSTRFGATTNNQAFFNGSIDEVKIWNRALSDAEIAEEYNRSMIKYAAPAFLNQTAAAGNVINRTKIPFTGQNNLTNISLYGNKSTIPGRTLIASNISSDIWYNIPVSIQNRTMDFIAEMQGNGTNTTTISSFVWDETLDTTYTLSGFVKNGNTLLSGVNVSTLNFSGFPVYNISNNTGYYNITGLKGTHTITANKTGYYNNISDISVTSDTTYNISMNYIPTQGILGETLIRINQIRYLADILGFNFTTAKATRYQLWNETSNTCWNLKINISGGVYTEQC